MCWIWLFPTGMKGKVILRDYAYFLVAQIRSSQVILGAVWQQLLLWRQGFLTGTASPSTSVRRAQRRRRGRGGTRRGAWRSRAQAAGTARALQSSPHTCFIWPCAGSGLHGLGFIILQTVTVIVLPRALEINWADAHKARHVLSGVSPSQVQAQLHSKSLEVWGSWGRFDFKKWAFERLGLGEMSFEWTGRRKSRSQSVKWICWDQIPLFL